MEYVFQGAATMAFVADILIHAPDGRPVAVVEVKNAEDLSPEVATALRRNMVAHGAVPAGAYFLLVSQDIGYLWEEQDGETLDTPPSLEFPMTEVVARYSTVSDRRKRLFGAVLEIVVLRWLLDLAQGPPERREEAEATLGPSGFLAAISGGSVIPQAGR